MNSDYISIEDAARLEGLTYHALYRRLTRRGVALIRDAQDARRKLLPVSALSLRAQEDRLREQVALALTQSDPLRPPQILTDPSPQQRATQATGASVVVAPATARSLQPVLPFSAPSESQLARDAAIAAVPRDRREHVERWLNILGQHLNGTWKLYQGSVYAGFAIQTGDDYVKALAHLHGISRSAIYDKLKLAREVLADAAISKAEKWTIIAQRLLPRPRLGRSSASFFADPENAWMFPELRKFYLNQAQFSKRTAWRMLCDLIDKKQRVSGLSHCYEKPTYRQVCIALEKIPLPQVVLARQGEKAFNDQCGIYLSRRAESLRANDLWVTDQRQVDVRLRDGGERLGRIWMVNFLDVASDRVLGYSMGPVLSSDMVMLAAVMALERFGVPRAVHMDLGKEFNCTAFNGSYRKFSGETLYRQAMGLWGQLGVKIVKAIGRNPQSKTIERWHAEVARFDRRFPGWCGGSTDERPEKLAREEAQHAAWLRGEAVGSPLVTIGQYINAYCTWAERDWNLNARGRGRMRQGMSPVEAWNAKQPAEGLRRIDTAELDIASADHRTVEVQRGGQVNLKFYGQTVEYQAPELFLVQGKEVEVIISRRTFRQVTVIYPIVGGTASCVARRKPQYDWMPENRDELRLAMRCKAAVHRAVRQGVEASRVALEAANPVEMLAAPSKLFGVPASLREAAPRRLPTAEELAALIGGSHEHTT